MSVTRSHTFYTQIDTGDSNYEWDEGNNLVGPRNPCFITSLALPSTVLTGSLVTISPTWTVWNPNQTQNPVYIAASPTDSRLSATDYRTPAAPETVVDLERGRSVAMGDLTTSLIQLELDQLEGQQVTLPVVEAGTIIDFWHVRLEESDLGMVYLKLRCWKKRPSPVRLLNSAIITS